MLEPDVVEDCLEYQNVIRSFLKKMPSHQAFEVLIQRLMANIISNAVDASANGSEVRIDLTKLAKTDASRDWLRIRVIDYGEGIPKEDLSRVFTAYFTTKTKQNTDSLSHYSTLIPVLVTRRAAPRLARALARSMARGTLCAFVPWCLCARHS
ncbi:MAG: ATP-binding protein [Verrucomicrobiota bacterium]|nr:ATP-binding protein [Verrucomicrobiota bacterium]